MWPRAAEALHASHVTSSTESRVMGRASLQTRDLWPTFIMANKFAGKHFHLSFFFSKTKIRINIFSGLTLEIMWGIKVQYRKYSLCQTDF